MTSQDYIDNNETTTFKKGDLLKMVNCVEAEFYNATQWVYQTNSFTSKSGTEVVFLENLSGYFIAKIFKENNGRTNIYKAWVIKNILK